MEISDIKEKATKIIKELPSDATYEDLFEKFLFLYKIEKGLNQVKNEDILPHYELDYSKAKPNRFAQALIEQEGYIKLQPDVKAIFNNSESVNKVLRAIIKAYPLKKQLKKNEASLL